MKKLLVFALFSGMLILFGCPMLTQNSIDEGTADVPKWLTGKWYEVKTEGKPESYEIEMVKGKTGHAITYSLDSLGKRKPESFQMIFSDVGGRIFWNVYEPGDENDQAGWYLYKFEKITNTEFRITPVNENVLEYSAKQEEIKDFLMKNKDNPEILNVSESARYKKTL